jgi:hypothetical protein
MNCVIEFVFEMFLNLNFDNYYAVKTNCTTKSPIKLIVLEFPLFIDEKKNVKIMLWQMFKGRCGILN